MPKRPRDYTAEELISEAKAAFGAAPSKRQLIDWTYKGLIGQPHRRSLGKGKGSAKGVWSEQQREVFMAVAGANSREGTHREGWLCNVTVHMWLGAGPESVPLTQVRRVLATFVRTHRFGVGSAAEREANALVDRLAPGMDRRQRAALRKSIVSIIKKHTKIGKDPAIFMERFDGGQMLKEASRAFQLIGSERAASTALAWVKETESRATAIRCLADKDGEIADAVFDAAWLIQGRRSYERWIELQADLFDHVTGHISEVALDLLVEGTCTELLTVVGLLLRRERPPVRPLDIDQGFSR